jgi:hypothetical protein
MTTTIRITTDGDFCLPDSPEIVEFGVHGYLIAIDIDPFEYLSGLYTKITKTPIMIALLEEYFKYLPDYTEFGGYSMTIDQIPGTPTEILNAARLLSPLIKD